MVIAYEFEGKLYVNVTNRCPNSCDFCIRKVKDAFKDNLWLEREPTEQEIIDSILAQDLTAYPELVFCGFGEPLERLDEVLAACRAVRRASDIPIRINTCGLANLMYEKDVTPSFAGLVDVMSVSLNAKNAQDYQRVCHSKFGEAAYPGLLEFAQKCRQYVPKVQLTIVDCIPPADIEACKQVAAEAGIPLRIRTEVK